MNWMRKSIDQLSFKIPLDKKSAKKTISCFNLIFLLLKNQNYLYSQLLALIHSRIPHNIYFHFPPAVFDKFYVFNFLNAIKEWWMDFPWNLKLSQVVRIHHRLRKILFWILRVFWKREERKWKMKVPKFKLKLREIFF